METLLIELGLGLAIGFWMYNDAKRRQLKQPVVWLWIGLLLGIIGLITYIFWHVLPRKKT